MVQPFVDHAAVGTPYTVVPTWQLLATTKYVTQRLPREAGIQLCCRLGLASQVEAWRWRLTSDVPAGLLQGNGSRLAEAGQVMN
jgi:hypothetical protein